MIGAESDSFLLSICGAASITGKDARRHGSEDEQKQVRRKGRREEIWKRYRRSGKGI